MIVNFISVFQLSLFMVARAYDGGTSYLSHAFPGIDGDLTKITWAHRVNSREKLEEALQGDKMMLEADVSIGTRKGDRGGLLMPIMAHPPETTSDLTLEEFLDKALTSDKGIKLDFKSGMAFSASENAIANALIKSDPMLPLMLNADIIEGPINCNKTPVDANYFLARSMVMYPTSIISVGWTTCYGPDNSNGSYSKDDIERMTSALIRNHVVGEVTFAVRAGLAAQSVDRLVHLISTSADATLTIWSSNPRDPVDIPALKTLIERVGRDKVFLDVTEDLQEGLNSASTKTSISIGIKSTCLFSTCLLVAMSITIGLLSIHYEFH